MTTNETRSARWLTPNEVAEALRLSRASIYRKIHTGELPAVRLASRGRGALRIRESELETWLTSEPEVTS